MKLKDITERATLDDVWVLLKRLPPECSDALCDKMKLNSASARQYAKLMLYAVERQDIPEPSFVHHMAPRSFVRSDRGNAEGNLVRLSLMEHWYAHWLLSGAAKSKTDRCRMLQAATIILQNVPAVKKMKVMRRKSLDQLDYNVHVNNHQASRERPAVYKLRQKNLYRGAHTWYGVIKMPTRQPFSFSLHTTSRIRALKWVKDNTEMVDRLLDGEDVTILTPERVRNGGTSVPFERIMKMDSDELNTLSRKEIMSAFIELRARNT